MERHVYSVPELLELRGSQSKPHLLDKISQHPELVPLVSGRDLYTRRSKKSREEFQSPNDSDDHVVFHGKKQIRQSVTSGEGGEWKYRGRVDVERPSNEPLPAPTGLAAQQSEGFRRFFKAVVSPTHVRVTAGGRIVPNTRVSTSPTARWDREQLSESDSDELSKIPQSDAASSGATPALPPMMVPPLPPPMASPWFSHMIPPWATPMPFFPLPNGYPVPLPMQPAPVAPERGSSTSNTEDEKQDDVGVTSTAKKDGCQNDSKPKPAPIKISPPEQFDHNRPFVYNGHVMYSPMTAHPPFMPPPFFSPAFMGHPAIPPGRPGVVPPLTPMSPVSHMAPVSPLLPYHAVHAQSSQRVGPPGQQSVPPQALPEPVSGKPTSIKRSEITKSQLAGLRFQVKFYKDQLLFNRHQIDERGTQQQIVDLEKHIEHFKRKLQDQLDFEARHTSRSADGTTDSDVTTSQTPTEEPSKLEDLQSSGSRDIPSRSIKVTGLMSTRNFSQDTVRPHATFRDKDRRGVIGLNSNVTYDTRPALEAFEAHLREKKRREREQAQQSGLPTGAAMAPPFEPAGFLPSNAAAADSPTWNSDMGSEATVKPSYWQDTPKDCSQQTVSSAFDVGVERYGPPYLVGKLPQGLSSHDARPTDYLYARELTPREVRARHVYWGQVPSKGLGLPKFDGKDFYPPSPIKPSLESPVDEAKALAEHPARAAVFKSNPRIVTHSGRTPSRPFDTPSGMAKLESDPFGSKRTRANRAVPIVDPETMKCKIGDKAFENRQTHDHGDSISSGICGDEATVIASPTKMADNKPNAFCRRALERSSKSGSELWQSMLQRGPISAAAVPTAVSSTTATGYLPQYNGYAAASLSPAIANTSGPVARALPTKTTEQDGTVVLTATEKRGENCPPRDAPTQQEVIADLHQRMLRDAEARGVIGPDWH